MPKRVFRNAAILSILTIWIGGSWAGPAGADQVRDIPRLIQQLGDDEFFQREAASQALEAIGEPAYDALRQAAGTNEDVEIRRRAEVLLRKMNDRAARRDQQQLDGTWRVVAQEDNGSQRPMDLQVTIARGASVGTDRWGMEIFRCTWWIVAPIESPKKVDLITAEGKVFHAIFTLDGDTLQYCGSFDRRPESFSTRKGDGSYLVKLKRSDRP